MTMPARALPRNLHTVLPTNSSPLERALVYAYDGQPLPVLIPRLKDPATCPVEYLPVLAYEYSVDVWSNTWPETIKRAVIKSARAIQARKGTIWAMKETLKTLGQGGAQIMERIGGRHWDDGAKWDSRVQWDGSWAMFAIQLSQPVTTAQGNLIIDAVSAVKPTHTHLMFLDMTAAPLRWDSAAHWDEGYTWDIIKG